MSTLHEELEGPVAVPLEVQHPHLDTRVRPGAVVQISDSEKGFAHCLMVVTQVDFSRRAGEGFVQIPARGPAYYLASLAHVRFIGTAEWDKPIKFPRDEHRVVHVALP